jgi:RNA polymerase sigma-70 factor (ECF subfamily)
VEPDTDTTAAPAAERELLERAQRGDERSFERLIEPYRGRLHAHCYRLLGSVHDAEDAYQEAMLRAWRGLPAFEGRSSLRSWLYRIATNASLRLIERRPKRVLPIDLGPPADPHEGSGAPLVEGAWVEPYPDDRGGLEDRNAGPEARYEEREAVELAFIAALQHLPPLQRAALILTDVVGFAPGEVAELLDATPASIYSALQRARNETDERVPDRSQQETLRMLGDRRLRELVDRFVRAWEAADVEAIRSMLADDVVLAMPPWPSWFRGRTAVVDFLAANPLSAERRWSLGPVRANGQLAVAADAADAGGRRGESILLLTLAGDGAVRELTAFRDPGLFPLFGLPTAMDSKPATDH